jgi:HEAT repeat protein
VKLLCTVIGAACLAVLAAGCGCGKTEEEKVGEILLHKGGYKAEVYELAKKGLPYLKKRLESKSSMARMAAIQAIGLLKDNKEATQILIELTKSDDFNDPWAAIMALGVQGSPEAKELIKQAMASENPRLREGACAAIYEYGDRELYPLLDKAANDRNLAVQKAAGIVKNRLKQGR